MVSKLTWICFEGFIRKFKNLFDKGSNCDVAVYKMFHLKQGRRSVASFSIDFGILFDKAGPKKKKT